MKQKKFVEDTIITQSPSKAVKLNYNLGSKGGSKTPKRLEQTAYSIATENLQKPLIIQALEKAGITRDFIAGELKDNITETKKAKQYAVHLKGLTLGAKLNKDLEEDKEGVENVNIVGYFNLADLKKNKDIIDVKSE